jgi:xanthine dehydrogenase accessory factor
LLWVDQREDLFPAVLPCNATIDITDAPEAVVRQAEAGSYFIVMTHSHALDQLLSERILRRNDAAWFGLIGSAAKRLQFSKRLGQRGLSDEQLAHMICPIGIPGIGGKEPASIAIAVAAQLLQLWEVRNAVRTSGEKCHIQRAGHN